MLFRSRPSRRPPASGTSGGRQIQVGRRHGVALLGGAPHEAQGHVRQQAPHLGAVHAREHVARAATRESRESSIFVVVFFRSIMMCVYIASFMAFQGELQIRKLLKPSQLYGRGLIEVGSTFFFLWSILILPLTNVYTILLTAPLPITATGAAFFR